MGRWWEVVDSACVSKAQPMKFADGFGCGVLSLMSRRTQVSLREMEGMTGGAGWGALESAVCVCLIDRCRRVWESDTEVTEAWQTELQKISEVAWNHGEGLQGQDASELQPLGKNDDIAHSLP